MRRALTFCLSLLVLLTLVACGEPTPQDDPTEGTTTTTTTATTTTTNEDATTSTDEGDTIPTGLTVNTQATGAVKPDAATVGAKTITVGGKTYDFPCRVGDLMADGWYLSDKVTTDNFLAKTSTTLMGYFLYHNEASGVVSEFQMGVVYNDASTNQDLRECWLTCAAFFVNTGDQGTEDFLLPGGINKSSTAADVLAVFGEPDNNPQFEIAFAMEDQLSYHNHKDNGLTYYFAFNEDGTIYTITIDYVMEEE